VPLKSQRESLAVCPGSHSGNRSSPGVNGDVQTAWCCRREDRKHAESAGLQKNDLIKDVIGLRVHSVGEFNKAMKRVGKNDSVACCTAGNNTFFVANADAS